MTTEEALKFLAGQGFDVKPLWREVERRVHEKETGKPSEQDLMWKVPVEPPAVADHWPEGSLLPRELRAEWMWPGYHYTLTPGQRKWFREVLGLTPSQTVTIKWVQVFLGTQHPVAFRFESDQHLSNARKHLLTAAVVPAGRFFWESAQLDAEIRESKATVSVDGEVKETKKVKKVEVQKKMTFDEMLAQLEEEAK